MAITMEELKRTRDKVRKDFHSSNQPLRGIYLEMLRDINQAIEDREREDGSDFWMEDEEGGEPRCSGMEDYLGIEDR